MFLEWVKAEYTKNKTALCVSLVVTIGVLANFSEFYTLESMGLPNQYTTYSLAYSSLYGFLSRQNHSANTKVQKLSMTFEEDENEVFLMFHYFCPISTFLFAGICSDKYGGHRGLAAGLIMNFLVLSTCYLAILSNEYVTLATLFVRRASDSVVYAASVSLAAKVCSVGQRTTFMSLMWTGYLFGSCIGLFVSIERVRWEIICEITAFVVFVTTVWWWMVYNRPRFPKIRKLKSVPWKDLLTSVSFYCVCFLLLPSVILDIIVFKEYKHFKEPVDLFPWVDVNVLRFVTSMLGAIFCGACSDYMISKGIGTNFAIRKGFIIANLVLLFVASTIVSLFNDRKFVVPVLLGLTDALNCVTSITTVMDFSPWCAGTVFGIGYTFAYAVRYPVNMYLTSIFNLSDSSNQNFSGLYFTIFILVLLGALPFLCTKFKRLPVRPKYLSRYSSRRRNKINPRDDGHLSNAPAQNYEPIPDM